MSTRDVWIRTAADQDLADSVAMIARAERTAVAFVEGADGAEFVAAGELRVDRIARAWAVRAFCGSAEVAARRTDIDPARPWWLRHVGGSTPPAPWTRAGTAQVESTDRVRLLGAHEGGGVFREPRYGRAAIRYPGLAAASHGARALLRVERLSVSDDSIRIVRWVALEVGEVQTSAAAPPSSAQSRAASPAGGSTGERP